MAEASPPPHRASPQNSFRSLLSYRLQSSGSASRALRPTTSFVTINNKRSFRAPPFILHSIVGFFPERVPLAFANVNPAERLFTEGTGGGCGSLSSGGYGCCSGGGSGGVGGASSNSSLLGDGDERLGYGLDGFRVSRAAMEPFIAPCDDGGVIEDDVAATRGVATAAPRTLANLLRGDGGSTDFTNSSTTSSITTTTTTLAVGGSGTSVNSPESSVHIQTYPFLFSEPGLSGPTMSAEQHCYPFVGYAAHARQMRGGPSHAAAAAAAAAAGTGAAGRTTRTSSPTDRSTPSVSSTAGGGPSTDLLLADVAMCRARCWQGGVSDLSLCASVRCTSTQGLGMALFSAWWLSRYHGVTLTLEGLQRREHLEAFKQIARLLSIRELVFIRCTLTQEWMQVVSSCSDLISLSFVACAAEADVPLMYVDSILTKQSANASTSPVGSTGTHGATGSSNHDGSSASSPNKPRSVGLSKWYIAGNLSVGILRHLRCLHLVHTPVTQGFLDTLPACAGNLECLLLHKVRGVVSLEPLAALVRLRCVGLQSSSIEDRGAAHLGRCTNLRRLALVECRRLTSLDFFHGLAPSLTQLTLSQNWFAEQHMQRIALCTELVELHLYSLKRLTSLGPLVALRNLEVLNAGDTSLTTEGTHAALASMRLTRVNLSSCMAVTSVADWLPHHLTTLNALDLSGSGVTRNGLQGLGDAQVLRYLNLTDCSKLTSISYLRGVPALRWLSLAGTAVTDVDLVEAFGDRRTCTLRFLSLRDCQGVKQLRFLRGLRTLFYLDLENIAVTDRSLRDLRHCRGGLRYLNLSRCHTITDLAPLASLLRLCELHVSHTGVTDAGLRPIAACTALEVFHARGCRQLNTLTTLEALPSLRELCVDGFGMTSADAVLLPSRHTPVPPPTRQQSPHISVGADDTASFAPSRPQSTRSANSVASNSSVTSGGLPSPRFGHSNASSFHGRDSTSPVAESREHAALRPASGGGGEAVALRTLAEASLRKSALTGSGLAALLCSSRMLARLDISECRSVRDLSALEHLCGLVELSAAQCTHLSNSGLRPIMTLRSLRRLSLAGCTALSDLAPLGQLVNLEELDASLTRVTDEGLAQLGSCTSLRRLSLADCRFLTSVRPLAPLRFLRELHLESTGVTNAGIAALTSCVCLQRLYLTKCKQVTDVTDLRAALRQLEVCDVHGTLIPTRVAGEPRPSPCATM